ncbi:hypothetical protein OG436_29390 [Streptomyces caniferus]|uniref:hypothetical protein n=1 Tax=Streptomyces caniferus TaxID=285557 RepID=UPI002E293DEF|nr:hypothetical protein [Streptomyces caniferus]
MTEMTPAQTQETEANGEFGTATLCGEELRVKPIDQWRPSYLRALREGDYDTWAAGVLHEDDAPRFVDLDATFAEINEFTTAAMESTGETPGKSGGRSARSKSTRKR